MAKIYPNHCHCPQTSLKLQERGGTVTHTLQVLHTLSWHHPSGRALVQLALAPTQNYYSYTHDLLGGVEGEVKSPNGSPVRWQENTELLSVCGLTGTPQRVPLLGLGGKGCSLACTGQMSMETDFLLCHRQRRSYLFGVISGLV